MSGRELVSLSGRRREVWESVAVHGCECRWLEWRSYCVKYNVLWLPATYMHAKRMFTCNLHKDCSSVTQCKWCNKGMITKLLPIHYTASKGDYEGGTSSDDGSSSIDSTASPIPTLPITYRNTSLRVMTPSKRPFLPPFFSSSYKRSVTLTPKR